jgi:protein-glutamine gamma-glutamyltransferase
MIQLSGKTFNHDQIWKSDSIEGIIVKRMQEGNVIYAFQTFEELRFELNFRKNIISSAVEMSKGEAKFNIFSNSRANPRYWKKTNAGGFLIRRGVNPSEAVRDIFINSSLYAFECATASIIILYDALLKLIGENRFNFHFQDLYLYSWHLDGDYRIFTFRGNHLLPGDIVYFNNPDYDPRTPWFRGLNAIDLGDGTYFGHGFGVWTREKMIEILNTKRKSSSEKSAHLTRIITRPIFKEMALLGTRAYHRYKLHHVVIHHNQSSISYAQYLSLFYTCPSGEWIPSNE